MFRLEVGLLGLMRVSDQDHQAALSLFSSDSSWSWSGQSETLTSAHALKSYKSVGLSAESINMCFQCCLVKRRKARDRRPSCYKPVEIRGKFGILFRRENNLYLMRNFTAS